MWHRSRSGTNIIPSYSPCLREQRHLRCSTCKRMFTNIDHLHRHVQLNHNGNRPHLCTVCGLRFPEAQQLTNHIQVHMRTPSGWESRVFESRGVRSEPYIPSPFSQRGGSKPTGTRVSGSKRVTIKNPSHTSYGTNQRYTITEDSRSVFSEPDLPGIHIGIATGPRIEFPPIYRRGERNYNDPNVPRVVKKLYRLPSRLKSDTSLPYHGIL